MNNKSHEPRLMYFDIETSHAIAAIFQLKNDGYIPYQNILQDWFIICASWKYSDENKVYTVKVGSDLNDYKVVKGLRNAISKADIIIGHNSMLFDDKKFKTRLLHHKLPPLEEKVLEIDTCQVARKDFAFTSNRLDYLAHFLGVGGKIKTTEGLWLQVLQGKSKAIKEMAEYNRHDVLIQEKVYLELESYISQHPSLKRWYRNQGRPKCPDCNVILQIHDVRANKNGRYARWGCGKCGKRGLRI